MTLKWQPKRNEENGQLENDEMKLLHAAISTQGRPAISKWRLLISSSSSWQIKQINPSLKKHTLK